MIIAEAGVNHNGDIALAKKLIDIAAESGADFVKFQTLNASRMVTAKAAKARYQILATEEYESQHDMLRKLELTEDNHKELIAHSLQKNIKFFSTGFDIQSIDLLINLGQEIFKIPSGEITNLPLLRHIGRQQKPIILSTGMSSFDEIESALLALEESGVKRNEITVLQCTTAYPTPISDVNLLAMKSIKDRFNVSVGYSDHTLGIEIPIAAVALGATIIEKHFTLDRTLPGPDHKASLEPMELKAMIDGIRNVELAMGNGIKRIMPSEIENLPIARKSIVTKQPIKLGEIFSEVNLTTKRPASGVSPMQWDLILGRKALRHYESDELIDET
jgi:N,N'-diacetyllegionaminate synthase